MQRGAAFWGRMVLLPVINRLGNVNAGNHYCNAEQ